jgi:hypothetical protein
VEAKAMEKMMANQPEHLELNQQVKKHQKPNENQRAKGSQTMRVKEKLKPMQQVKSKVEVTEKKREEESQEKYRLNAEKESHLVHKFQEIGYCVDELLKREFHLSQMVSWNQEFLSLDKMLSELGRSTQ